PQQSPAHRPPTTPALATRPGFVQKGLNIMLSCYVLFFIPAAVTAPIARHAHANERAKPGIVTYVVTLSSHFCSTELFRRDSYKDGTLTLTGYHKRSITKLNLPHPENPPLRFFPHVLPFNVFNLPARVYK
uniref:hypothetical protein n=1 Tax=Salmonella enterica TaxID=28901 RepID=UPI00398C470A